MCRPEGDIRYLFSITSIFTSWDKHHAPPPPLSMPFLNRCRDVLYSHSAMATVNETKNSVLTELVLSLCSELPTCPQNVFCSYFCKSECNKRAHGAHGCYEPFVSFNLLFLQVNYLRACPCLWISLFFLHTVASSMKTNTQKYSTLYHTSPSSPHTHNCTHISDGETHTFACSSQSIHPISSNDN